MRPWGIKYLAAAQDRPQKSCRFDGFSADPKLGQVSTGDLVVPYYTEGAWTCGYVQHRDGAGPQWVKSSEVHEVKPDPAPPLSAWAGKWVNGDGRIVIELAKSGRVRDPEELRMALRREGYDVGQLQGPQLRTQLRRLIDDGRRTATPDGPSSVQRSG